MYLMLKNVLPEDVINIVNEFAIDKEIYKQRYDAVVRQVKWRRVHNELMNRLN